tara:strand:+ start:9 stop:374 length:366 start_codon:yes stop_codon:yes gene_type:complete
MTIDNDKLNTWLKNLNKRESEDLKRANLNKYDAWTEEVIIPKIIFEKFSSYEKSTWQPCSLEDIYTPDDVKILFGVKPNELNECFSKKFFNLTKEELEEWEIIGKNLNTNLPINDVLIIFT